MLFTGLYTYNQKKHIVRVPLQNIKLLTKSFTIPVSNQLKSPQYPPKLQATVLCH